MLPLLLTAATTAAAAASVAGYATMAPRSQLFGAAFSAGDDPSQMALTYDDGPNDPHTFHLLDLLARHEVKATFFVIGRFVRQRPDILRAIAQAGHAIGNHTWSHPNLAITSPAAVRQELAACRDAIADAGILPAHPPLFRPPFGARRPDVLASARGLGCSTILWSVTCYDWHSSSSSDVIIRRATRQITRQPRIGNVILLHDGGHGRFGADRSPTIDASRRLLERYKMTPASAPAAPGANGDRRFEFVTIPRMMLSRPRL